MIGWRGAALKAGPDSIEDLLNDVLGLIRLFQTAVNGGMGAMHIVLRLFSEVALLGEGQGGV